jgi:hypothetical protein
MHTSNIIAPAEADKLSSLLSDVEQKDATLGAAFQAFEAAFPPLERLKACCVLALLLQVNTRRGRGLRGRRKRVRSSSSVCAAAASTRRSFPCCLLTKTCTHPHTHEHNTGARAAQRAAAAGGVVCAVGRARRPAARQPICGVFDKRAFVHCTGYGVCVCVCVFCFGNTKAAAKAP